MSPVNNSAARWLPKAATRVGGRAGRRRLAVLLVGLSAIVACSSTGAEANDRSSVDPTPGANAAPTSRPAVDLDSDIDLQDVQDVLEAVDDAFFERMPDFRCVNLQTAENELQDLTGEFFASDSRDASGEGRNQIFDRNWVVVDQDPDPGERIVLDPNLYVLKNDEAEDAGLC